MIFTIQNLCPEQSGHFYIERGDYMRKFFRYEDGYDFDDIIFEIDGVKYMLDGLGIGGFYGKVI